MWIFVAAITMVLTLVSAPGMVSADQLPDHTVASDRPIGLKGSGSRRVEVHVTDGGITKEQCKALLKKYAGRAGSNGQVSVRKPSRKLGGELQPWCVDNRDGSRIIFNDFYF
jgi:hypothetical protein